MLDASPSVSVPRISTERLLLREYRIGDFAAYADHLADPIASEHLDGAVDRRAAWRAFAAQMGCWMLQGAGWWAVELKEAGQVVGVVGAFFRESAPEDLELGWSIYRSFWRRGFATEAAAVALASAIETHRTGRVIAHISAANLASVGVSRRLGMRYEQDVGLFGAPVGRYALER
jgi:RimJ/RimL family protein N-acetyltransferase